MARNFELLQTKGTFELRGKVTGVGRDNFYKEGVTSGGREYRAVKFGVEVEKNRVLYIDLFSMVQDKVYFYDKDSRKSIPVDWKKRHNPEATLRKEKSEEARLIGMGLGLTKGKDGKNEVRYMVQFDGAEYINAHLKDGISVYIRGSLEFGHFQTAEGETVKTQKLVPQNIYLANDIDFDAEDFEPMANFTQDIVFLGVEKVSDSEGIVNAHIVNYNTIETDIFSVTNIKLAKQMGSRLSAYDKIRVYGNITTIESTEAVEDVGEEVWGEENEMEKQRVPYRRVFLITGAKPNTVDSELYDEDSVLEAIQAMNKVENAVSEFGDDEEEDWGDAEELEDSDEAW